MRASSAGMVPLDRPIRRGVAIFNRETGVRFDADIINGWSESLCRASLARGAMSAEDQTPQGEDSVASREDAGEVSSEATPADAGDPAGPTAEKAAESSKQEEPSAQAEGTRLGSLSPVQGAHAHDLPCVCTCALVGAGHARRRQSQRGRHEARPCCGPVETTDCNTDEWWAGRNR